MRLTVKSIIVLLALGGTVSGCNGNDLVGGSPFGTNGDGEGGPDQGINPNDPHNGGNDEEPPPTSPNDYDFDGDGIPNADDLIPCLAIFLKVWNQEVTSAEVNMNGQNIVPSSWFPTTDIFVDYINASLGQNVLEMGGKVAGSPEDQLHIEVWDTNGVLYLHETIVRGNGQPESPVISFDVNADC